MSKTNAILSVAVWSIVITGLLAAIQPPIDAQQAVLSGTDEKSWQAVASGLVEPHSGKISIGSPIVGRINEVLVNAADKVIAGQLLIRLDDQDLQARVATAEARVAMQKRLRNDQAPGKAADRRKAEDAVADAAAALVAAREGFDKVASARSTAGGFAALAREYAAWTSAQDALDRKWIELGKIKAEAGTPLPTDSEGQLNVARLDLWAANVELEKTRIRSSIAGTVLKVRAKAGELAVPSSLQALIVLGDISALQVRAELDERDLGKVRVGQPVVIRADAFPGNEFAGKVSAMAPIVESRRVSPIDSRNLTDSDGMEVLIDLNDPGPLMVGMKVNVYFQAIGITDQIGCDKSVCSEYN
jgi:HlyD family secretion protein